MERLTYRDKKRKAHIFCKQMCADAENCTDPYSVDLCQRFSAFRKLAELEDLEEQGRLLRLPCKEAWSQSGDEVYLIYEDEIIECIHCGLSIDPVDGKAHIALAADEDIFPYRTPDPEHDLDPTDWCTHATDVEVNEIGKKLFFTREEAEAKMKEMETT